MFCLPPVWQGCWSLGVSAGNPMIQTQTMRAVLQRREEAGTRSLAVYFVVVKGFSSQQENSYLESFKGLNIDQAHMLDGSEDLQATHFPANSARGDIMPCLVVCLLNSRFSGSTSIRAQPCHSAVSHSLATGLPARMHSQHKCWSCPRILHPHSCWPGGRQEYYTRGLGLVR